MRCLDFVELVTSYLVGGLDETDREEFERHLGLCPGCERYLDQFRATIGLLGELPPETISPVARHELLDAFAGWRRGPTTEPRE
jgi:anti-sigma factor RsiW